MNLQEIIQSGYKATIVECGHGADVSNAFLSQPGASNFIVKCIQPYSKEIQRYLYPNCKDPNGKQYRSVSKDFVYTASAYELLQLTQAFGDHQKLLVVTTSFQLDDGNGLTHGYLNIVKYNNGNLVEKLFHLSFYRTDKYDSHTRKTTWISRISSELKKIIYNEILGKDYHSQHIDGVWKNGIEDDIITTLKLNHVNITNGTEDNFICIKPGNKLVRFEDIIRENKTLRRGLILQKGSYNPLHRMHKKIADDAKQKYNDYPHVLMLSMNTCDKGDNNEVVLAERIKNLTEQGYTVIVSRSGMFIDNVKKIREHYPNLEIIFPVGEDTIERFFRDWEKHFDDNVKYFGMRYSSYQYSFRDVTWLVSRRESETKNFGELIVKYQKVLANFVYTDLEKDDISSTAIRTGKIKNE
jgi:nicotinic acid mononucleotide adenylyltransferase